MSSRRTITEFLSERAARAGLPGVVSYHSTNGAFRLHWGPQTDRRGSHLGFTDGEARREIDRQAACGGFESRITARMVSDAEYDLWCEVDTARAKQIIELGVGAALPAVEVAS